MWNPDRAGPPRRSLLRRLALACAVGLGAAACSQAPAPTPAAPSDTPLPAATFLGGRANADLDAPEIVAWRDGWCTRGTNDAWLAINIGDLNGSEYFGLVVGAEPHADALASPVAGGGTFRGASATITWRHAGARFVVARDAAVVVVAPDLRSGTFGGTLADGREVSGSFACP